MAIGLRCKNSVALTLLRIGPRKSQSDDFIGGTKDALREINKIIQQDGSGNIKVIVGPIK